MLHYFPKWPAIDAAISALPTAPPALDSRDYYASPCSGLRALSEGCFGSNGRGQAVGVHSLIWSELIFAGKEGWKLVALLRLSPVIPWNVLNYSLACSGAPSLAKVAV